MITNMVVDLLCIIIAFVVSMSAIYQSRHDKRTYPIKTFIGLSIGIMFILVLDIFVRQINGKGNVVGSYIFNTLYWLSSILFCLFWLIFIIYYVAKSKLSYLKVLLFCCPAAVIEIILLFVNIRFGFIFSIEGTKGILIRGPFYKLNIVFFLFYIISALSMDVIITLTEKEYWHKKESGLLIIYAALPLAGLLIEAITFNFTLIWPFETLTLLMMYVSNQQNAMTRIRINEANEREKRVELENEIVEQNVKVMLSQIQPHFLYNCLTTIAQLCDIDPKTAKQATIDFSKYLRTNLDSIKATENIPFLTELDHIKKYLSLEKLRFEDDLNIVYDIEATSFMIPTLSVQPLVENAVKYGVCQKENGGTVFIISKEEKDSYVILVKDDGVGFDLSKVNKDGRTHIGIENARQRLEKMCHATLNIESTIGVGTIVTIRIPKEEKGYEDNSRG